MAIDGVAFTTVFRTRARGERRTPERRAADVDQDRVRPAAEVDNASEHALENAVGESLAVAGVLRPKLSFRPHWMRQKPERP